MVASLLVSIHSYRGIATLSRIDSDIQANALSIAIAVKQLSKQVAQLQLDYDVLLIENEQQREELYELRLLKAR